MESGSRPQDAAASACIASNKDPAQFAPDVARALFPAFDVVPVAMLSPFPLPNDVGLRPTHEAVLGIKAPFTVAEFLAAIDHAKQRTAPGPDGITYEVYKNIDNPALVPLLDSVNQVWLSGQLPDSWLRVDIVPIPKPGKPPHVLQNLRPIALTSTLCKLLERMLATRLQWWLDTFQWYHPAQIGFRPYLGTEDGLEYLSSMVLVGGRCRRVRSVLAMDICKAYDNVSHAAILQVLNGLHLPDKVCDFVRYVLQHRSFSIRINGASFGHFTPVRGVPQGGLFCLRFFSTSSCCR